MIAQEGKGCRKDLGVGHGLGGGSDGHNVSMEEAKRLRLERLGQNVETKSVGISEEKSTEKTNDSDGDVKMEDAEDSGLPSDPTANLDSEALEQLTSVMGFTLLRAQKGLLYSDGTMESAVE